jgi:hypothetical protein
MAEEAQQAQEAQELVQVRARSSSDVRTGQVSVLCNGGRGLPVRLARSSCTAAVQLPAAF